MEGPSVSIGAIEGDGPDVFQEIEDLVSLNDRSIAVLDRGAREVRIFDASGSLRARMGSEGAGPEEFRDPIEIERLGSDTLVVFDWQIGRLTVLDGKGAFVRSVRLDPPPVNATGYFGVIRTGLERSILVAVESFRPPEAGRLTAQFMHILRYDETGGLSDTIATLPYGRRGWVDIERRWIGSPLFEPRGTFAVRDDEAFLSRGDAEIRVLASGEKLTRIMRWDPPDRLVRAADVDAYRERRLRSVAEPLRERVIRQLEAMPVNELFPALRRIEVDDSRRLWVELFERPGATDGEWLMFEADGMIGCRLRLPIQFEPLDFNGGFVTGTRSDELGVQYVESHPVMIPR